METFEKMQSLLEEVKNDVSKFYEKRNDSAGARIRKAMQEIKKLAQQLREEVQENRKNNQ
jgi:hypothetical protein